MEDIASPSAVVVPNSQLRKRAHRALSEESIRQARMTALRQELARLEEDHASTTPTTQDTIVALAKSECLALTQLVMTRLPRELRDMIYHHLSTRSSEVIERSHFRTTLDPLTRLYSYDFSRWKAQHFPDHYWDTTFTGEAFSQELIQNYYRRSKFIFGDTPGVLKRFLTVPELHPSILPCDFVADVEIHLNAVSHDRGSFRAYMFGIPKTPERMREALSDIWMLKRGTRIVIRFFSAAKTVEEKGEHCRSAVKLLFCGEEGELRRRYKVRVVLDEGEEWDLETVIGREWREVHG